LLIKKNRGDLKPMVEDLYHLSRSKAKTPVNSDITNRSGISKLGDMEILVKNQF